MIHTQNNETVRYSVADNELSYLGRKSTPEGAFAFSLRRSLVDVIAHPFLFAAPQVQSFLGGKKPQHKTQKQTHVLGKKKAAV